MTEALGITDLRRFGFVGFVPVAQLDRNERAAIPRESGVYAVVREITDAPRFLERSGGGWFKGEDPTVRVDELEAKWVPGVQLFTSAWAG